MAEFNLDQLTNDIITSIGNIAKAKVSQAEMQNQLLLDEIKSNREYQREVRKPIDTLRMFREASRDPEMRQAMNDYGVEVPGAEEDVAQPEMGMPGNVFGQRPSVNRIAKMQGNPEVPRQEVMSRYVPDHLNVRGVMAGNETVAPEEYIQRQMLVKSAKGYPLSKSEQKEIKKYQGTKPYVFNAMSGKMEKNPDYETANQKAKRERAERQDLFRNATTMRQEFIKRPEVEDYLTVSTNVSSMEKLLERALAGEMDNKVALDQALITMYNKLTDPASVVRESEYARTPSNLPMVNAINGAFVKLSQGGAGMTDRDRQALVEGAKIILQERGRQYNTTLEEYNNMSERYGLDRDLITRGMKPHQIEEAAISQSGIEAGDTDPEGNPWVEGEVYYDGEGNQAVYQNGMLFEMGQ